MGVWLRARRNPAAFAEGLRETLQFLPAEFHCRRGNVWRIGRPLQLWAERYLSLLCAGCRLEFAKRLDVAPFTRLWAERQQPWLPAALGYFARNQRIRSNSAASVWSEVMKSAMVALTICALLLVVSESSANNAFTAFR